MVTKSEVKVGGQGQGISHGVKSGEGSSLGSRSGSRSGEWSRFGVSSRSRLLSRSGGQGRESRSGVKVRVKIGGHKVWGQDRGSMLGVKIMGRGSMPGGLGSGGRCGEVGDNQSVPFKNSS